MIVENPLGVLNKRQKMFIDAYLIDKNATKAASIAGYSSKYAHTEGHRLLNNSKVKDALDYLLTKKLMTRESFVDKALDKFETVPNETVKPRYLEIAGKAMGYLGAGNDSVTSVSNTTNNVQINMKVEVNHLSESQILDKIKSLLD